MTSGWLLDDWREAFRTEARLRKLPGAEVGEALAEVEAYCADSGSDPAEAFGEPAEYAEVLAHAHGPAERFPGGRRQLWLGALVASGTLVGVMSLLTGVDAVTRDIGGALTVGQFVSAAIGVAGIVGVAALLLRSGRPGWWGVDWRFGLVAAVGIAVTAVPQLLWEQVVLRTPGWLLLGVGLVLLVFAWWPLVSGRLLPGRLLPSRVADSGTGSVRTPWLPGVVRWGLPVGLLCAVLVAVLLGGSGG